jgi:hypothetical protein
MSVKGSDDVEFFQFLCSGMLLWLGLLIADTTGKGHSGSRAGSYQVTRAAGRSSLALEPLHLRATLAQTATLGLVAAFADPGGHGRARPCQRPARAGRFSGAWSRPLRYRLRHRDCAGNRSHLTSRRHRHRPARCMKGPPQVHRRSVGGQRKLARQRLTGSRFIHGRPLHSAGQAGHAGADCCPGMAARMKHRGVRRAGFRPRPRRYPGTSRVLATAADPADHAGQTAGPPVSFWGWRAQRAVEIQKPAVR